MKNTHLITFDLDSTLADTGQRHHLIDRENGTDWVQYSMACADDALVEGVAAAVRLFDRIPGVECHGLSARMSEATETTWEWLREHDVPLKALHLDKGKPIEYTKAMTHADYKLRRLREVEKETGMKVILHIDDYASVGDLFTRSGIPTICVRTPQEIQELVAGDLKSVK